jgi:hypothetical protein
MEVFFDEQTKLLTVPKSEFDPVYEDIKKINYHKEEMTRLKSGC